MIYSRVCIEVSSIEVLVLGQNLVLATLTFKFCRYSIRHYSNTTQYLVLQVLGTLILKYLIDFPSSDRRAFI